ncbi:MAG: hypothetical protein Q7S40_17075 [Opitutaceae bacterium]|nr:hypothetical protein [Opitutaceae bacterium]
MKAAILRRKFLSHTARGVAALGLILTRPFARAQSSAQLAAAKNANAMLRALAEMLNPKPLPYRSYATIMK